MTAECPSGGTSIVVPVHNAPEFVARLIDQLSPQGRPVVWVDDASDEPTSTLIAGEPHYIRNARQQLFTRTSNRGIRYAYRHFQSRYVAVVNTDCDLRPGWLEALEQILDRDESVGMVGYDHAYAEHEDPFREVYPPAFVTGHCLLLRTEMLRATGLFIETDTTGRLLGHTRGLHGLAHIGSDHWMSLQAAARGWRAGYCAKDLVGHAQSRSWLGGTAWLSSFHLRPLWEATDWLDADEIPIEEDTKEIVMGETRKAHARRQRENFYDLYCKGQGIDIGVGRIDTSDGEDALPVPGIRGWDKDDGDATFMQAVPDETYDFVYASHVLEHISNATLAIKNWWRILKPGGHLILYVPHRDLYEKRTVLPSGWNSDHKFFLLPSHDELPFTLGLEPLVDSALSGSGAEPVYVKVCDEGHTITDPFVHSDGEYSIEMVVRKMGGLAP